MSVLAAACLLLAACATKIERQALPFESPVIEVAPGAAYERCVRLEAGERLLFSYRVDPPMSFAIRRQSGNATLSFLLREKSREESGIFLVPETEDYCLHWAPDNTEATWPTLLRFDIRANPSQ
jgi:hypothetical protein